MIEPTTLENIRLVNCERRQKRREGKGVANGVMRDWVKQRPDIVFLLKMDNGGLFRAGTLTDESRVSGSGFCSTASIQKASPSPGPCGLQQCNTWPSQLRGECGSLSKPRLCGFPILLVRPAWITWRQQGLLPTHKCHQTLNTFAFSKLQAWT